MKNESLKYSGIAALTALSGILGGCSFADSPENLEPEIILLPADGVTRTDAILSAEIRKVGQYSFSTLAFSYVDPSGNCFLTEETALKEDGSYDRATCNIGNLLPSTTYRYKAIGYTSTATMMTEYSEFTTLPNDPPSIGAVKVMASNPTSLIIRFRILSNGGEEVTEAGCDVLEKATGRVWHVVADRDDMSETGECTVSISSLLPRNSYSVIPYAANSIGRSEGDSIDFETTDAYVIEVPGSLHSIIGDIPSDMETLSISGVLNGDDFRFLRELLSKEGCQVTMLDLSGVVIRAGGGPYAGALYTVEDTVSTGLFSGLTCLREIILPITAVKIMSDAFRDCSDLGSLTIPRKIESVVSSYGCGSLEEILVSEANPYFASLDGMLYDAGGRRLIWFPAGKKEGIRFAATVEEIGRNAFRGSELSSLGLPESVKRIGDGAFSDSRLRELSLGKSVEYLGEYVFDNTALQQLLLLSEIPPVASEMTFGADSGIFDRCTLSVPVNSVRTYRNHPVWGRFKDIKTF